MRDLSTARFRVFWARTDQDRARAQALRHLAFRGGEGLDCDPFDAAADHVLIETPDKTAVATFRITTYAPGDTLRTSYCAQAYDLTAYAAQPGRKSEVGRFCLHPARHDADLVRLCWATLAGYLRDRGVSHLFGCSSFAGADPELHGPALAWLFHAALGPDDLRPVARVFGAHRLGRTAPEVAGVPDLLRFYVGLGAWVADHAIVDRDLNTLHVFTALDITRLTPAQERLLQALARTPNLLPGPPVDAGPKAV